MPALSMTSEEVTGKLAQALPFVGSTDELAALARLGELRSCEPDAVVQRFGENPNGLWFVIRGLLQLSRSMSSGKKAVYGYVFPGEVADPICVIDGLGAPFDIVVHAPSFVVYVPIKSFNDLLRARPEMMRAFAKHLCYLRRVSFLRFGSLAFMSPRTLIARLLLLWAKSLLPSGLEPFELPMNLTQEDIGSVWGLSRSTVNKELAQLARDGIIEVRYCGLAVLDPVRLYNVAAAEEPFDFFESAILGAGRIAAAPNAGPSSAEA